MSDAFGKITGFILAAFLLFIVPVVFYANRQQNLSQLYVINECVKLVEAVKNTGVMTKDMHRSFEDSICLLGGRCEIDILRSHAVYNQDENGNYIKADEIYHTPQLAEEMEKNGYISFNKDDYIYLKVTRIGKAPFCGIGDFLGGISTDPSISIPGTVAKNEVVAFYGGYIK